MHPEGTLQQKSFGELAFDAPHKVTRRDQLELWDFVKALEAYYNADLDEAQEPAGEVLLRALEARWPCGGETPA